MSKRVILSDANHEALINMLVIKKDKLEDEANASIQPDRVNRLEASIKKVDQIIDELEFYDDVEKGT